MVTMTKSSSDPLLDLIHRLRKQAGISVIPISEAEARSGLIQAFSQALTVSPKERPRQPLKTDWQQPQRVEEERVQKVMTTVNKRTVQQLAAYKKNR